MARNYEKKSSLVVSVPRGKIKLADGDWQFVVTVKLSNFPADEVQFFIDGNPYGDPKPISETGHVNCTVKDKISEEVKFVEISATAVNNETSSNIHGYYSLEIPEIKKEVLYPDKIRFDGIGQNGEYLIFVSLTDQKGDPIGNRSFYILNDKGQYLAKKNSVWSFQDNEYIFTLNNNGVLDQSKKPRIKVSEDMMLGLVPIDFRLTDVNNQESRLPEITLKASKKVVKYYEDNNFYGYALFSFTLLVLIVSIVFRFHIPSWIWTLDAILIFVSIIYLPIMFHDEIYEAWQKLGDLFREDRSKYYKNLEDRPDDTKNKVKEAVKDSAISGFSAGFSWLIQSLFIEGLGHLLFGKRRR